MSTKAGESLGALIARRLGEMSRAEGATVSLQELSRRTGLSQGYLSRIVGQEDPRRTDTRGKRLGLKTASRLASALGLSLEEVLLAGG